MSVATDNPPQTRKTEDGKEQINSTTDSEDASDLAPGENADVAAQPATPAWGSDAPDGGATAWLCVLGAWCTAFCSFGWINSIGVFQEYYQSGPLSDYPASTVSWIPSLQIFFILGMGPFVGKAFDTWGPRPLLIGGTFLHVFGLMMASISTQYYQYLLSQGVCSAIGVAAIFQPAISCIPGWFFKKRGTAFGILSTGSSIGGIIFPIMISRLIRSVGYGWAMRSAAFLILALLAVANFTVRTRHPPSPKKISATQMLQPLRERGFIVLMAGMFVLTFGIFAPVTFLQVQALEAGMKPDLAQYLVAIFNAGSMVGRLSSGVAADKIGRYNTFVIACGSAGILTLSLWVKAEEDPALIAFAVLFGTFSGAYISLFGALVAQVSPLSEIGFRTGLVFCVSAIPGLITSPIAGAILANAGGWLGLKVFAGSFIVAGTALTFLARLVFTDMKFNAVF